MSPFGAMTVVAVQGQPGEGQPQMGPVAWTAGGRAAAGGWRWLSRPAAGAAALPLSLVAAALNVETGSQNPGSECWLGHLQQQQQKWAARLGRRQVWMPAPAQEAPPNMPQ